MEKEEFGTQNRKMGVFGDDEKGDLEHDWCSECVLNREKQKLEHKCVPKSWKDGNEVKKGLGNIKECLREVSGEDER